jgi:hypothetical protein
MAKYPDSPVEILLKRIVALLSAADWADLADVPGVTVRHARNRAPMASERPCVSVGFVDDDDFGGSGRAAHNAWEVVRELKVDLQFDADLDSEDSALDVTGWGKLLRMAAVAFDTLRIMDDTGADMGLSDHCDDVFRSETGPNEDSDSDKGRLVQGLSVIYRVSATSPNRLLATGVTYP